MIRSLLPFLVALAVLIIPVAAETTIVFQDVGLATQDIDVFDAGGNHVRTINTSGVLTLDDTGPYTLKLKPGVANQDPGTLIQQLLDILANNLIVIIVILFGAIFLFRRR